jgi:hypothetical protein
MASEMKRLFVYSRTPSSPAEFVAYWSATYSFPREYLYTRNINGPHTPETLGELFLWKIGDRFAKSQLPKVQKTFIARLDEARELSAKASAESFLREFPKGGAIHRIFWLHCWQPMQFPIYDQHVHRAMTFLLDGQREELDEYSDRGKVSLYTSRFLPFFELFHGVDPRETDGALWAFGKFIKPPVSLPIE